MAERELPWVAGRERREYLVRSLRNRDAIRERLQPLREHAAYALAQLEPGLFERTRWFTAEGAGGRALVTHSRGGLGDATFVTGDPEAATAILSIEPGPARSYLTCRLEHVDAVRSVYHLSNSQPMLRMSVTANTFRRQEVVAATCLLGIDIRRINQLYGSEGNPTYYDAGHIDGGVYRGVVISRTAGSDRGYTRRLAAGGDRGGGERVHPSPAPRAGIRDGGDKRRHRGAAGAVRHRRPDRGPVERARDHRVPATGLPRSGGDAGGDGDASGRVGDAGPAAAPAGAAAGAAARGSAGFGTLVRLHTNQREGERYGE